MAALRAAVLSVLVGLVLVIAPSAGAIVDGEPFSGANSPVVFVGQMGGQACTGVAVSPTLVLTAAHCGLLANGTAPDGQVFAIRKGPSIAGPYRSFGVFTRHPDFAWGDSGVPHFADNDLAVIRLLPGMPTIPGPYATLPQLGFVDELRGGLPLTLAGYGVATMVGHEPDPASFGVLRRASGRLLGGGGNANFLHFNGPTCFGDSGGGVYYGNVVLGVVSFAPSGCKSTNYATRLDTESARRFLSGFGL